MFSARHLFKISLTCPKTLSLVFFKRRNKFLIRSFSAAMNAEIKTENAAEEDAGKSQKRSIDSLMVASETSAISGEVVKKPRIKKKKVAMLISYCGQGYYGMQINHGFKTIEGDLFDAMLKVGIMDEESYKLPQSIQFQRAARTDKGVSAMRQVVSLKMDISEDTTQQICSLNSNLPDCIRVFALKKVTSGFNSKIACDSRSYAYILPSFAFAPIEEVVTREYRMTGDIHEALNETLALFKGTHNYHNFTSRRPPQDPSCKRYITDFSSSKPFLVKDMEFVKITVKGQSFMLHQIRKMVGLTIAILRGFASRETLDKAFKMERVDIPIAPSLNLLLEQPHYNSYNRRYGNDSIHEPLDWETLGEEVDKFCNDFILPVIYAGEIQDNSMLSWLSTLSIHTYSVREDGPSAKAASCSELGLAALNAEYVATVD